MRVIMTVGVRDSRESRKEVCFSISFLLFSFSRNLSWALFQQLGLFSTDWAFCNIRSHVLYVF